MTEEKSPPYTSIADSANMSSNPSHSVLAAIKAGENHAMLVDKLDEIMDIVRAISKRMKISTEKLRVLLNNDIALTANGSSNGSKPTNMTTKESMAPEESITLIKANLAEVLNPEIIDKVILEEKRPLRIYWGTAPIGEPNCGYFVPLVKVPELLQAACHVKILLADVHAQMESLKIPFKTMR